MRKLFLGGGAVALALLFVAGDAIAQTVAATTPTDLSSIANQLLALVFAGVAGVVSWLLKRGVVALENLNVLQTNSVHGSTIDNAVTAAVNFAQAKLEALIDPKLQMTMTPSVLSEAAQLVATTAPNAVAALGLTPASIAAKIQLALGNPLAAADAPAAAAASPPAPAPAPVAQPGS